jgi:hypothetical protein
VPASGGQSTQLFQRDGYAIGVIAPAPDNSGVLSSFVNSSAAMITAVNNNTNIDQIRIAAPTVDLVYIPWNGGVPPTVIAPGGQPAFGKGAFTAAQSSSSVTVSNGPVTPPALVVGGGAIVVTTKGDVLNLRGSPSKSAKVLAILKAGAILRVTAGPTSAEGLRWWQVLTSDGVTGWVADQVTDKDGTTNTLTPAN